jgi:hypothetical protein
MEGAGVAQLIDEEEFPQSAGTEYAAFYKTRFTKTQKNGKQRSKFISIPRCSMLGTHCARKPFPYKPHQLHQTLLLCTLLTIFQNNEHA